MVEMGMKAGRLRSASVGGGRSESAGVRRRRGRGSAGRAVVEVGEWVLGK